MSDCPFCERDRMRSITAVKPQFDPPRVLTNSTEGIHPVPQAYFEPMVTVDVSIWPNGQISQMRLRKSVYDKLFGVAQTLRMLNNQRETATRFRRRMRSIRATLHLRA